LLTPPALLPARGVFKKEDPMAVFLETFESLFPLYFFIALGALLRKSKIIPESMGRSLNRLVFVVFIATALFVSTYDTDLAEAFNLKAILFAIVCVLVQAAGGVLFALRWVRQRSRAAVVAQCAYRSNFNLHGLIYGTLLFGAERIGVTSILIAVMVPLYNILSVLIFEFMLNHRTGIRPILKKLITNPIILAVLAALFFKLTGLKLPAMVYLPVSQIASSAAPLALMAAGAALTFEGLRSNRKAILAATAMRTLIVPALFVPLAIWMGFREILLLSFLVAFGGPVASPLPAMAYNMGGDGELASQAVAVTSLVSLVTLHFFILLLRAGAFL
jgi:predicted permease